MWNLVADVGGTNMRLAAVSAEGQILAQRKFTSDGHLGLAAACAEFITEQPSSPTSVAVAAAGVVKDGAVQLTNAGQGFSVWDLAQACGTEDVHILNDLEGAAWSLATIDAGDVDVLQGTFAPSENPMLIVGSGTGLGVGAMIFSDGKPNVVSGEGGHVRLAPESADEVAYFERLITLWPEIQMGRGLAIEAEAILSGTGLPVLYKAIALTRGLPIQCENAEDVLSNAQKGSDAAAVTTADLFRRFLGALAGDLALTVDARGGVFITGGVVQANPWLFDTRFNEAFNAGGRHSNWRATMPVFLYKNKDFGLIGARNYLFAKSKETR